VTVVDDDECTDLSLEATHLPTSYNYNYNYNYNSNGVQNSIATFTDAPGSPAPGPDGVGPACEFLGPF
jgi:hypothetical protein